MSEDEIFVMILSGVLTLIMWGRWYHFIVSANKFHAIRLQKNVLSSYPVIFGVAIWAVLSTLASFDVVTSMTYKTMYLLMGMTWLGISVALFPFLGISWRDDILERRNNAALIVLFALMSGITSCYCGANIGDGPGWWCVVFAGGMAQSFWFFNCFLFFILTGAAERITIDRDVGSAIRTGGFLISSGLIFGRGGAGDWVSAAQTFSDFSVVWPSVGLLAIAIGGEYIVVRDKKNARWDPSQFTLNDGVIALLYGGIALFILLQMGPLPQNGLYSR